MSNALTITAPPGLPFIDGEREFDAPLAAVWRAYTEPELISQWMGPHGTEMENLQFESRTVARGSSPTGARTGWRTASAGSCTPSRSTRR